MSTHKAVVRLHLAVKRALKECCLTGGKRLVVAVSGGPDSLAMLFALNHLRAEFGLELHGAHLDHGLRADDAQADARFVTETFQRLGIDLTSERADVPSYRKRHRLSLEEAAREVRYEFLGRVAVDFGADAIAVGHTSDDQAETVLMHIIRGTGLTGLRGMETLSRRTFGETEAVLVRPLLGSSREDTCDYCQALDLEPRIDQSNLSVELTRNRVRMDVLPLLEKHNPAIRAALVRLSRSAAQEMDYLDSQVDRVWPEAVRVEPEHVALNREAFRRSAPALQAHMLRRAVAVLKGDLQELEQSHVDDMARLMEGPAGRRLDLPGGVQFAVGYAEATIAFAGSDLCPLPPLEGERRLRIPGETLIHGWRITADVIEPGPTPPADAKDEFPIGTEIDEYGPGGLTARLSDELLGGQLHVRPRRRGERFQPLGMSQSKKLQDFMVDSKIPRHWRDRVPLVCSPRGIAWVVGWRVADWARVKEGETRQLLIRMLPHGG